MSDFSNLVIVRDFVSKNNGIPYGVYSVDYKDENYILVRNNDSLGVVQFVYGKPATECIHTARDDWKQKFFDYLESQRGV